MSCSTCLRLLGAVLLIAATSRVQAMQPAPTEGVMQRVASDSAASFVAEWRRAMAQPGAEAIADLTAFPFQFQGQAQARPAFSAQVVPALFTPKQRRCLQQTRPVVEEGRLILFCAPYGFVLGHTPVGWRLLEFFVDAP